MFKFIALLLFVVSIFAKTDFDSFLDALDNEIDAIDDTNTIFDAIDELEDDIEEFELEEDFEDDQVPMKFQAVRL